MLVLLLFNDPCSPKILQSHRTWGVNFDPQKAEARERLWGLDMMTWQVVPNFALFLLMLPRTIPRCSFVPGSWSNGFPILRLMVQKSCATWDVCNPPLMKTGLFVFHLNWTKARCLPSRVLQTAKQFVWLFWCQRRCNHIAVIGYVTTLEVPGFKLSLFCCSVARNCEVVVKSASVLQELGITRTGTQTIFRELNLERLLRKKAHLDR